MIETTDTTAASVEVVRVLDLAERRPARAAWQPYLSHPHPDVRQTAVDVVAELRPDWGFDVLCLALLDAADRVRVAAAEGLRPLLPLLPDRPQLFDFLEQALASPSPQAREVAVRLLRRTSDASVSTFAVATRDSEPRVRVEAVRALAGLRAVDEIGALAGDDDRQVRVEVAKAIGRLADPRGIDALRRLARDPEPTVRVAAVAAAPEVPSHGRLDDAVLAAAHDVDWPVRKAAAVALGAVSDEHGQPALVRLATDSEVGVRRAALTTLAGRASSPVVHDVLVYAVRDSDAHVRAIARSALRRRPPAESIRPRRLA